MQGLVPDFRQAERDTNAEGDKKYQDIEREVSEYAEPVFRCTVVIHLDKMKPIFCSEKAPWSEGIMNPNAAEASQFTAGIAW
jgi:hypothetical protein